jgi:prophage regulatory protein
MALPTLIPGDILRKRIPFSQMHIDRLEAKGEFPQRVRVGKSKVAWIESEVEEWLASRERGVGPAPRWNRWTPSTSTETVDVNGASQK